MKAFIDLPTEPEQRVQRLYAWVAVNTDGSEGLMGIGNLPLISSKRRIAVALAPQAQQVARLSAGAGKPVRVELRVYNRDSTHVIHRFGDNPEVKQQEWPQCWKHPHLRCSGACQYVAAAHVCLNDRGPPP